MNRKKKIIIFTDIDLDGAMSYLLFSWFKGYNIPVIPARVGDFRNVFEKWMQRVDITTYDHIYILDLDVSNCIDLVDRENVVVIDHHLTHVSNKDRYHKAKLFIKEGTSCSRLIYNLLYKKSKTEITAAYKYLVLLVDDYDSYTLQLKESYDLNLLFWNYQGDRVRKFVSEFNSGFNGFTKKQTDIIKFHKKKVAKYISDLEMFSAEIPISGKRYKFVSAFADSYINDIADHILKVVRADVGVVVNLNTQRVSLRKEKGVDVDLSQLAVKLLSGGGHHYASGGKITDQFMIFSKMFKPINTE